MSRKLNELFSNGMQIALEENTIRQIKKNIIAVNVNPEVLSIHLLYKDYLDDYKVHIFMSYTKITVEELSRFSDIIESLSYIKRIIIHIPKYLDKPLYEWIKNLLSRQYNVKIIPHTKLNPLFYIKSYESNDHMLFTMLSISYIQKINKWQIHLDDIDIRCIPKSKRDLIFK